MTTSRIRSAFALIAASAALIASPAFAQFASPMRDVENPDHFAFMVNASVEIDAPFVNNFLMFSLANNKRYFFDEVALTCNPASATDTMTQVALVLSQTVGSSTTGISGPAILMNKTGPAFGGGSVWVGSALIKAFHDTGSGNNFFLNIFHTESSNTVTCTGFLSGHTLS
jgi:hypothetical protein